MSVFICVIVLSSLLGHIGGSSFPGHVDYLGCYGQGLVQNHLRGQSKHVLQPFLASNCFHLCSGNGHRHAGLDSLNAICYCGTEFISLPRDAEYAYINHICKVCKDDILFYCGVHGDISIYIIEPNIIPNNTASDQEEAGRKFNNDPVILLAGHGGIYMYNATETNNNLKTVINVTYTVDALDYHLRRREGFAIWNEIIYRFPLFEDEPLESHNIDAVTDVNRCYTFAVDWVHDMIFWPDCNYHTIKAVDIKSHTYSPEETIIRVPDGAWALDMVVDPYKGLLFWTTGATLMSCRLDGRGLRKVVPEFPINRVSHLSLDLVGETVFCAGLDKNDKNTSMIYVSFYTGSHSFTYDFHQYEGGNRILNFGLIDHTTYFYLKATENNYSYLMKSELRLAERPTIYLKEKDIQLNRFRLIHPRLQAPPKVDACTNRGCTHLCVMEDSLPRCYCPRYHILEHDNKTCYFDPGYQDEEPLLIKVTFGMILVLLVVTGAGVLMCLVDKLWSQLHPAVVRLRGPRTAQSSFTGRRTSGTENLI